MRRKYVSRFKLNLDSTKNAIFTSGEKSIPLGLQNAGMIVVVPNYRLSPQATAPSSIEDAAAAVAWAFANVERYGGSRKLIYVAGHSAGGYLASMTGLDKRWLKHHQLDANDIAGLIPVSGQAITHFTIRRERGISEQQPIIDDLAPLFHVRRDAPPLLLISGDRNQELLGRYEESAYFWRMMKIIGHPDIELIELTGRDHANMVEPAYEHLLQFVRERFARIHVNSER